MKGAYGLSPLRRSSAPHLHRLLRLRPFFFFVVFVVIGRIVVAIITVVGKFTINTVALFGAGDGADGFNVVLGFGLTIEGLDGDLHTPEKLGAMLYVDAGGEQRGGDLSKRKLDGFGVFGQGECDVIHYADPGGGVELGVEVAEGVAAKRRRLASLSVGLDMTAYTFQLLPLPRTFWGQLVGFQRVVPFSDSCNPLNPLWLNTRNPWNQRLTADFPRFCTGLGANAQKKADGPRPDPRLG